MNKALLFLVLPAVLIIGTSTVEFAFSSPSEITIVTVDGSGFGQDCAVSNGGSGCYDPLTATVDIGGKVIMVNSDSTGAAHSFTSGTVDGFSPSPDGIFDSELLNQDESFEWNPETEGEYPYYCFLHTWMQGTILVEGGGPISPTVEERLIALETKTTNLETTVSNMFDFVIGQFTNLFGVFPSVSDGCCGSARTG